MKRLVSNQISPNFTLSDSIHAAMQIWRIGSKKDLDFSKFLGTKNYFLTNAARTGLAEIVRIVNPPKEKKIGIPAFICAVVATPFLEKGYQIEWINTDKNGVISVEDFLRKAENLSMIVVPHIFGQRAPIEEITKIAKPKGIFVIEDCAHLLPTAKKEWNSEGPDVRVLSFGREKVLSCVSGGAILWSSHSPYAEKFQSLSLHYPPMIWTLRHIGQPLIFALAIPFWYFLDIGKIFVWVLNKAKILPRAVTSAEKEGREDFILSRMSVAAQYILFRQWKKREIIQSHRKEIAAAWKKTLSELFPHAIIIVPPNALRVIMISENVPQITQRAKHLGFHLRDWDGDPIAPKGVLNERFGYVPLSCPEAEFFNSGYLTFPTNIRTGLSDVHRFETMWKILYK